MFLNVSATHRITEKGYDITILKSPLLTYLEMPPPVPITYSNVVAGCISGCLKGVGWEGVKVEVVQEGEAGTVVRVEGGRRGGGDVGEGFKEEE